MKKFESRLFTLGTGSASAETGRGGSAHLVETSDVSILLDAGEGCAARIKSLSKPGEVNDIFISHLHPDHVAGLFTLIQNRKIENLSGNIRIFMPREGISSFREMLDTQHLFEDRLELVGIRVSFHAIETGEVTKFGNTAVTAWKSDHLRTVTREAFGFTVDYKDFRLIYTSDISSTGCFMDQVIPGCTVLCEAMHVDYMDVTERLLDKGVSRLIFTHADPLRLDEITEGIKEIKNVHLANDLEMYEW